MILHDRKKVFIHIPKCGGMSVISQYYKEKYGDKWIQERGFMHTWDKGLQVESRNGKTNAITHNLHADYQRIKPLYPDYQYFTQIRHPLTRWESIYKHLCDHKYIKNWTIEEWTMKAIPSLRRGSMFGCVENIEGFESQLIARIEAFAVMYKPSWIFYREPDVAVHKLEEGTLWNDLGLNFSHIHRSNKEVGEYDFKLVEELVRQDYDKDWEKYGG